MKKEWKMWEGEDCAECGSMPEVFTSAKQGLACDGDPVRCPECDMKGGMTVDDAVASVNWDDF